MLITRDQHNEIRDDNILTAVVKSIEVNTPLVATAALEQGIEITAEQYGITLAQVHGTLALYYKNQAEMEQRYQESQATLKDKAADGWQRL